MPAKSILTRIAIACLFAFVGAESAHAYYAPQSGRFLSRDPIMYPDGANTYAAWYVPADVDPDGSLSVTVVSEQQPRCNNKPAIVSWQFALDNDAPCNGFIVQKVTVTCGKAKCSDALTTETFSYFESWRVVKHRRTGNEWRGIDRFRSTPSGCQKGTYEQTGELRFYCNSALGLPDRYRESNPGNGWGRGGTFPSDSSDCSTTAGGLYSREDEPGFWATLNGATEYAYRWAKHDWNCCPSQRPCCGDGSLTTNLAHSP